MYYRSEGFVHTIRWSEGIIPYDILIISEGIMYTIDQKDMYLKFLRRISEGAKVFRRFHTVRMGFIRMQKCTFVYVSLSISTHISKVRKKIATN